MIAVLTGIAIPCCSPRDVNEFEVVVVGLVAIHDELSSVVSLGAGDRRVSSTRVVSLRVGISPKCENRPQIVWGVKGLSVKVCRVSVCPRGDEVLLEGSDQCRGSSIIVHVLS